ncbi:MAG: 50S ribosomal protein L3 [Puniceicoccales bacterium]|jgi:large subunit ribosomal protein L3|nr:50S ribosomal protein L3 [Puniceicoccales bacterium]
MKEEIGVLGKKIGMTQVFDAEGDLIPVTVVRMAACRILQKRMQEQDGYEAVQMILQGEKQGEHVNDKATMGRLQKAGCDVYKRVVAYREIRGQFPDYQLGDTLDLSLFQEGEKVDVVGITKGHGFQGVMKRYGFSGGPASHGAMFHRRGGSYGQRQWPGHVIKGKKMPGHFGMVRRTVQNLKIVKILKEENLLLIRGSFPGVKGATVFVRKAIKAYACS